MPNTISADQVIGKTLHARTRVDVKTLPFDGQATLYSVAPGNVVGVVYAWVEPTTGRKNLWWQIEKEDGSFVWVEHYPGRFDTKKLEQQGVTTLEDQAWQEKPLLQKAMTIGAYVLGGFAVIKIAQMNEGNW